MKKIINLLLSLLIIPVSLLLTGFFYDGKGIIGKGVSVYGVDCSFMTCSSAEKAIRKKIESELENKTYTISAGENKYVFYYPEIGYKSDVYAVLEKAFKHKSSNGEKANFDLEISYYLKDAENIAERISADCFKKEKNAEIAFFPQKDYPFEITEGIYGSKINKQKLLLDIQNDIYYGKEETKAVFSTIPPPITKNELAKATFLKSSFSTYYGYSTEERKHNIALACEKINGYILADGETFSFNKIVGERTEEQGFMQAKIISGGRYVDGFGGGVCQVSTTLYNAALISGLKIIERYSHSLAVNYVEPSFDAMVSSASDFRFMNDSGGNIFISATADGENATIKIFGKQNIFTIERESVIKEIIPQGEAEEIIDYTNEYKLKSGEKLLVHYGKEGIVSEGFLNVLKNGVLTERVLIRKDKYQPTQAIIYRGL